MLLATTLVLMDGQAREIEAAADSSLAVGPVVADQRHAVLATLLTMEDTAYQLAYAALACYGLALGDNGQPTFVDLTRPLVDLRPDEQAALRELLIGQSWPAWARAPQHLRALLGCPEPPLLLADAARQLGLPLATLANAAARERLPTIRAGDRHLVYLATIVEAQGRGLLHPQRGRPRRGKAAR